MSKKTVFVNRRHNSRRTEPDPCTDLSMDLYHRKRRKSTERRDKSKSLVDDYYAFSDEPLDSGSVQKGTESRTPEMSD